MKKQPGVNGEWIAVSLEDRVSAATLPSLVALGTPALVHLQYAMGEGWGERGWLLPAAIWVYGILFWLASGGRSLLAGRRWKWTEAAAEERMRYWSDARKASRQFWGHWWVRFPIGLVFLSYGVHLLTSRDFSMQWLSMVLLLSAFVTPFVFVAELALLPLVILALLAYLAVATRLPASLVVMLSGVALVFSLLAMLARRGARKAALVAEGMPAPAEAPAAADATAQEAGTGATADAGTEDGASGEQAAGDAPVAALPAPDQAATVAAPAKAADKVQ